MARDTCISTSVRPEPVEGLPHGGALASTGSARTGGEGARALEASDPQRHTVTLDHPTDWPGFRTAARALVQARVPPHAVDWRCQADAAEDYSCR